MAAAVQQSGCLARFLTSGYYKPATFPDCLLARSPRLDAYFRRRHLGGLDPDRVVRRWDFELPELLARRLLGNGSITDNLVFHRDARFDRWVARRWARACDIYWGFQGSCLESLRAARRAGKLAVAEFATAHVTLARTLLSAEAARHPEWADTIGNLYFPDWYRRRLEQEPHEAHYCIAASDFTRRSLTSVGVPADRIKLLPLAADLRTFTPTPRSTDGPFRVLFVGGIGQRKGIKYLLEAFQRIRGPGLELVLVGPRLGSGRALRAYEGLFEYRGQVASAEVVQAMRACHVLVLPSVFEGFGLVIPEAMATGMPVIASTHTVAPEVVRDGDNGFVLAPDDVEGLATKLAWLATHREAAAAMGRTAAATAQDLSWEAHQRRVAALIDEMTRAECPNGGLVPPCK
jgi:glycosyltransferase involved in cell wall biosynthesis